MVEFKLFAGPYQNPRKFKEIPPFPFAPIEPSKPKSLGAV